MNSSDYIHSLDHLKSGDEEYRINCPYCAGGDEGYHLYINSTKNIFHCFKCDSKGKLASLLKYLAVEVSDVPKRTEMTLNKALELLNKGSRTPAPVCHFPTNCMQMYAISGAQFTEFHIKQHNSLLAHARVYLNKRGLDAHDIVKYGLQYAHDGRYRYRIIFPCYERGVLVYFTARSVLESSEKKYINPTKRECPNGKKGIVFNIDRIKEGDTIIIAEGMINAILMGENCVATLGKFVSEEQYAKLMQKRPSRIIVALDGDALHLAYRLAMKIYNGGIPVGVLELPIDKDASDIGKEEIRKLLLEVKDLKCVDIVNKLVMSPRCNE